MRIFNTNNNKTFIAWNNAYITPLHSKITSLYDYILLQYPEYLILNAPTAAVGAGLQPPLASLWDKNTESRLKEQNYYEYEYKYADDDYVSLFFCDRLLYRQGFYNQSQYGNGILCGRSSNACYTLDHQITKTVRSIFIPANTVNTYWTKKDWGEYIVFRLNRTDGGYLQKISSPDNLITEEELDYIKITNTTRPSDFLVVFPDAWYDADIDDIYFFDEFYLQLQSTWARKYCLKQHQVLATKEKPSECKFIFTNYDTEDETTDQGVCYFLSTSDNAVVKTKASLPTTNFAAGDLCIRIRQQTYEAPTRDDFLTMALGLSSYYTMFWTDEKFTASFKSNSKDLFANQINITLSQHSRYINPDTSASKWQRNNSSIPNIVVTSSKEYENHIVDFNGTVWDGHQPLVGQIVSHTGDRIFTDVQYQIGNTSNKNIEIYTITPKNTYNISLKAMKLIFC